MDIQIVEPQEGLFLVERTSSYLLSPDTPPCEEAHQVRVLRIDTRCFPDLSHLSVHDKAEWYSKGTNHRIEDGKIKRDIGYRTKWAILNPDLIALSDKYGEIIIGKDEGFRTIEIYDNYRE